MGKGLSREQHRQMDLVLTHVGTGHDNRVVSRGQSHDWHWEVLVEDRWMIAYTGSMIQCIEMERHYDDLPHIITTAWGDPVCCN